MREGRQEPAQNENEGQGSAAVHYRLAVILNIFRHRETQSNHGGVDNAINDAVKLVLLREEEDEKDQSLGALLNDRCGDDGPKRVARSGAVGHQLHCHIAGGIN